MHQEERNAVIGRGEMIELRRVETVHQDERRAVFFILLDVEPAADFDRFFGEPEGIQVRSGFLRMSLQVFVPAI